MTLASHHPAELAAVASKSGSVFEADGFSIRPDGVFDHSKRLADLADVIAVFQRSAAVEIRVDGHTGRDRQGMVAAYSGLASVAIGGLIKNPEGGQ